MNFPGILKGNYTSAAIYASIIEDSAIMQIKTLCNQEFTKDSKICIMPDVHYGVGCTIGTTMTIIDKVCPNLVGADIGCGMLVCKLKQKSIDFKKLDTFINDEIPSGLYIRHTPHPKAKAIDVDKLHCSYEINKNKTLRSIGTLGGGNHFIEIDKDDEGNLYLIIHSGSRHTGLEIADFYQNLALNERKYKTQVNYQLIIDSLKKEGKTKKIEETLHKMKRTSPTALAYLQGETFKNYIDDMKWATIFANINREAIAQDILEYMKLDSVDCFSTIHNYIDTDNMILRKGAVSAQKGERLIIPMNMRDGSLICIGKGNKEWNYSAPHGAGRRMSRKQALLTLDTKDIKEEMKGIFTTSICDNTMDEAPIVYKSTNTIINDIKDICTIEKIIKPVYNFKAHNDD